MKAAFSPHVLGLLVLAAWIALAAPGARASTNNTTGTRNTVKLDADPINLATGEYTLLETLAALGAPMSPQIARKVVQHFHQLGPVLSDLEKLTPRERQVLDELAKGSLYKEIADHLGIGIETVRSYLSSIYAKLHVHNRTEAVVKYLGR